MSTDAEDVVGGGAEWADSMMAVLAPAINALDKQVLLTRHSQTALFSRIEEVSTVLHSLPTDSALDIEGVVRKLDDSERRIARVGKTLEKLTERLGKLQREMAREKNALLNTANAPPLAPPKR